MHSLIKVVAARVIVAGLLVLILFFTLLVFWPVLLPLASLLALTNAVRRSRLQGT